MDQLPQNEPHDFLPDLWADFVHMCLLGTLDEKGLRLRYYSTMNEKHHELGVDISNIGNAIQCQMLLRASST